eukprot:gnl/MRDRNA2_/MRDRNA2_98523_c0_seq1.p1 gnl/MRDRNA2_/MRDRNA2_98523_c0~~gnl/MRDRNA2_/MRDRNA2_98523_c0_seq1.p1  ORF type:complete len:422 (-),score=69.88 gnl/MRDRNA2_/MRDRNA2_98523_c0_seq1:149-1414(-)
MSNIHVYHTDPSDGKHMGIYRSDQPSQYVSSSGWLTTVYHSSPEDPHVQGYPQQNSGNSGWLDSVYGYNQMESRQQRCICPATLPRSSNTYTPVSRNSLLLPAIIEEDGRRTASFMGTVLGHHDHSQGHHHYSGDSSGMRTMENIGGRLPLEKSSAPGTPGSPTPSLIDLPKDLDVSSSDSDAEMTNSYWLLPMPSPNARLSAPETWRPTPSATKSVKAKREGPAQYEDDANCSDAQTSSAPSVCRMSPLDEPDTCSTEIKLRQALERLRLSQDKDTSKASQANTSSLQFNCTEKGSQASISTPRSMKMRHVIHWELRGLEQELQVLTEDLDMPSLELDQEPRNEERLMEERRRTAACKVAERIRHINEMLNIDMPGLQKDATKLTSDLQSLRTLVQSRSITPASTPAATMIPVSTPPVPK